MSKKKRQKKASAKTRRAGPVPYEVRLRVVREVLSGGNQLDVALAFGISHGAVQKYMQLFRHGGLEALKPGLRGGALQAARRAQVDSVDAKRREVVAVRQENPDWGTRRIRDVLARFAGLGVSETEVRRILHEEGLLPETPASSGPRPARVRRFERAEPNQLWQSDIFTFTLRRYERIYVAAFMDDHSRYIVSYTLAHHQKAELVLEALERGIAEYGTPQEVLTDNGRQYTSWRGETSFEQLLRRQGIRHIRSRPQHPQTLGKVERFWKTLWEEHLVKTVFADFDDLERRFGLWVRYYNFQRPHQALGGLVPADRFFRAAPAVRAAIEKNVEGNALRLAQQQPPRKPFYLVGRLGDQDLQIAAQGGRLHVRMGSDESTIEIPRENDNDKQASRFGRPETQAAESTDSQVAGEGAGPGPDRTKTVSDGPVGAVGGAAGDRGDRRGQDLEGLLLPAGDAGADGDAAGADAGYGGRWLRGRDAERPAGGAGSAGEATAAGEAPCGADAPLDPQAGETGAGEHGSGPAAEVAELDDDWGQKFAFLEEAQANDDDDSGFDPDAGWRADALNWPRKLAGAEAPWDAADPEEDDGTQAQTERTVELCGSADGARGAERAAADRAGGDQRHDDDERGGDQAGHGAQQLSGAGPQDQAGADRESAATADGTQAQAGSADQAGGGERATAPPEREADDPAAHDGPAPGRGGGGDQRPAGFGAGEHREEDAALAALIAELDAAIDGRGRGPGNDGAAGQGGGRG